MKKLLGERFLEMVAQLNKIMTDSSATETIKGINVLKWQKRFCAMFFDELSGETLASISKLVSLIEQELLAEETVAIYDEQMAAHFESDTRH